MQKFVILSETDFREILRDEIRNHSLVDSKQQFTEQPIGQKELCQFLDITEPTLIRWRKKGKIPYLKVGSRILYVKSAVLADLSKKS